jgi:hypothetical protein
MKGSVAHLRPPVESVERANETARPGWVVVPRYQPGADAVITPLPRARAFMHLVDNAFNFDVHGGDGFEVLAKIIDECHCYEFTYSRLDDAAAIFENLARARGSVRE